MVILHMSGHTYTTDLTYLAKQSYGRLEHKMEHLACFAGGMYAMGSIGVVNQTRKEYFKQMAVNITDKPVPSCIRGRPLICRTRSLLLLRTERSRGSQ